MKAQVALLVVLSVLLLGVIWYVSAGYGQIPPPPPLKHYGLLLDAASQPVELLADRVEVNGGCSSFYTGNDLIVAVCVPHIVKLIPR